MLQLSWFLRKQSVKGERSVARMPVVMVGGLEFGPRSMEKSRVGWRMLMIPALGRQRQEGPGFPGLENQDQSANPRPVKDLSQKTKWKASEERETRLSCGL